MSIATLKTKCPALGDKPNPKHIMGHFLSISFGGHRDAYSIGFMKLHGGIPLETNLLLCM